VNGLLVTLEEPLDAVVTRYSPADETLRLMGDPRSRQAVAMTAASHRQTRQHVFTMARSRARGAGVHVPPSV
jgi:hypothetical protein